MNKLSDLIDRGLVWNAGGILPISNSDILPLGIPEVDQALPGNGLLKGSIHEWRFEDNFAPLSFLSLLASQSVNIRDEYVVWIGEDTWPTPHSLYEIAGSEKIFSNSFFINPGSEKDKIWLVNQTLKTKGIGLIIANLDNLNLPTLKKFSLNARENGIILLIVKNSNAAFVNFCLSSRWQVKFHSCDDPSPNFQLKLAYCKGSKAIESEWKISFKDFKPEVLKQKNNETFYRYLSTA